MKEYTTKKTYYSIQNMFYVMSETIKKQKIFLLFLIIYVFSAAVFEYLPALINSFVIAKLEAGLTIEALVLLILSYLGIMLIIGEAALITKSQMDWRLFFSRTKFISKILKVLMNMDYEFLEQPKVMDVQQRALSRTSGSNSGIQGLLEISIKNILNVIKIVIALTLVVNKSYVIVSVIVLLTVLHFFVVDGTKRTDKKKVWDALEPKKRRLRYVDNMTTNFAYGKEIRLFHISEWLLKKQKEEHEVANGLICKSHNLWFRANVINQVISITQQLILYGWLVYGVINGTMNIAMFILYIQVIPVFTSALSGLLDDVAETRKLSSEVTDYRYFLSLKDTDEQNEGELKLSEFVKDKVEFRFENVSFKYAGQEDYALKDVNLVINAGKRLAIVGLNGAGKSTFVKLLMRLYEPTEGTIYLNDINIRRFNKNEYFHLFAPIFQNIELYAFSLMENITMKMAEDSNRQNVEKCLRQAGLWKKITELPNGIDSQILKVIYDDGIDLSGGEKQKLAIARALYKKSMVLILDEPTAALDAYSESELYNSFDSLVGEKTAVYISHRLASTRFCDEIAVFSQGHIIEFGTHEELMRQGKKYFELYQVQSKYYKEGCGDKDEQG